MSETSELRILIQRGAAITSLLIMLGRRPKPWLLAWRQATAGLLAARGNIMGALADFGPGGGRDIMRGDGV